MVQPTTQPKRRKVAGYNPETQTYTPGDSSVSRRMTGLLQKDNPYMQQAATRGAQEANRRGLLNSSIAVGAVESARIDAALPIASQEAGQAHDTNIRGRELQLADMTNQRGIDAQREFLGMEIGSRERLQEKDIASRERLSAADNEAAMERLTQELGSRARLQEAELAAQRERLGMQLSQQEALTLQELRAAEDRLGIELSSRERMQGLDLEMQERLKNMDISATQRNAAAQLTQGFESTYSQVVASIMNNPKMPSDARQRYLDHALNVRSNNLAMVEMLYGFNLQWRAPTARPATPSRPDNRRGDFR